jgi:hypothetical protein
VPVASWTGPYGIGYPVLVSPTDPARTPGSVRYKLASLLTQRERVRSYLASSVSLALRGPQIAFGLDIWRDEIVMQSRKQNCKIHCPSIRGFDAYIR